MVEKTILIDETIDYFSKQETFNKAKNEIPHSFETRVDVKQGDAKKIVCDHELDKILSHPIPMMWNNCEMSMKS